jgi:hemerythrin-like domain-containing protein
MYDALLEEHTKLRGLLRVVTQMLTERSGSIAEPGAKLRELGDLIDSHFHEEEASDCFPDLVSHAPRVSERVSIMLAEHGELRAAIHQIVQDVTQCSGTPDDWQRLAAAFQAFSTKLLHHEQTENELVQEVFTDDIGSKD